MLYNTNQLETILTNCYSPKWHISSRDHFPMISSHVDTSWKSLKVTKKTPNLEDPYLEFCNTAWPHLYTVGNLFQLAKTFQKTPKSENAQKYPKNEFFDVYAGFLKETRVRMRVAIYNSHVHPKYANFYITTHVYSSCTWLLFLQQAYAS